MIVFNSLGKIIFLSLISLLLSCGGGSSGGGGDTNAPVFKSNNKVSVNENQVAVTTVKATDQSAVTYSIVNKDDSNHFSIKSGSGNLTFKTAPDYENPADADTNNIYKVTVRAIDKAGNKAEQQISVTVLDVDDTAPVFKSNNKVSVNENQVAVTTVKATDQSAVTYSIVNKDDSNHFSIKSGSGNLTFKTAPDYENPADADTNNIYKVTVRAIDKAGNKAEQQISVTVLDVNDTSYSRLSSYDVFDDKGNLYRTTNIHYDSSGRIDKAVTKAADGSVSREIKYTYTPTDLLETETEHDYSTEHTDPKSWFTYDSQNRVFKKETDQIGGGYIDRTMEYFYNPAGLLNKTILTFDYRNINISYSDIFSFSYDAKNRLVLISDDDGSGDGYEYSYTDDKVTTVLKQDSDVFILHNAYYPYVESVSVSYDGDKLSVLSKDYGNDGSVDIRVEFSYEDADKCITNLNILPPEDFYLAAAYCVQD